MKKIFAVTAAFAVCFTFTSCGDKNTFPNDTSAAEQYTEQASETAQTEVTTSVTTEKITEVITEETTAATTAEEATAAEWEYAYEEKNLIAFLNYLQNGSYYCFESGNSIDVYGFMDDFKVDGYSYEHRGGGVFDVKLTCSESTCELFPNGDSYWIYSLNYSTLFIPAEREEKFDVLTHAFHNSIDDFSFDAGSKIHSAYNAAVNFSLWTGAFEADGEWFENYIETNAHRFLHAYNPYIENNGQIGGVFLAELARATKKLYNVTLFGDSSEISADETFTCDGHGGCWLYDDFAGYDETEDEIKVRVDYYGDELYLFVTVQSEYTFLKNADGTVTLQRVEKIFDKGYEPAWGAI